MINVAVFAHNEADIIAQTLESIKNAGLQKDDKVFVLINGCTDATYDIVKDIAKSDKRVHPVNIELGDKSNAWNVYVDQLGSDQADMHIFLDGDVLPSKNAFTLMEQAFRGNPNAAAVSTLPEGGRKSKAWAKRILAKHGMPGNMYGLSKTTFQRIKDLPIRLPIGLVGDDTLLRFLLLRDLDPQGEARLNHIQPVSNVFFKYESFPLTTFAGLKAMYRRHVHYARRDLEHAILVQRLEEYGITSMPRRADALWSDLHKGIFTQKHFRLHFVFFPLVILKTWFRPKMKFNGKAWDE